MKYLYVGSTTDIRNETGRDALPAIRAALEREFRLPTREIDLPSTAFARDPARGQYASIPVLEMLVRNLPADTARLLAVTGCDLFIPVLTFVFGHAQLGGPAAVVSVARLCQEFYGLPPDRAVFLDRAAKEALHETGHMFGLVHCADRACAMSLSTGVRQIDLKKAAFCPACHSRLGAPGILNPEPRIPNPDSRAPL